MKKRINWVWWHILVIPPTWEAETKYDKIKVSLATQTTSQITKLQLNETLLIAYI